MSSIYGYRHYNTAGVVMRDSFAAYVEKFKGTHPIRSKQNAGVIPLGDRKKHYMASISMPDEDTIHLNFYGHPLVTWKSDDSFEVFPPRYYSAYAVANIHHFLPAKMEFDWNRGRVVVKHNDNSYLLGEGKTIKFKKVGPETYELVASTAEYAIRKKRGSEKKFVKECSKFLDWMELVQSIDNKNRNPESEMEGAMDTVLVELGLLTNDEFDKWCQTDEGQRNPDRWEQNRLRKHVPHAMKGLWRSTGGFHTEGCKLILNWITEPMSDKWVTALYIMMFNGGKRGYDRLDRGWTITLSRKEAEDYIAELVKHVYFEHCFDKVPLGAGEIPTKQNVEYQTTYRLTR
jgi:hypothetical protein